MSYVQSEYPGAVTGRTIGVLCFLKAATWICGSGKSVPGLLCLFAEGEELWLKICPLATQKTTPRALVQLCRIQFLSSVE